MTGAGSDNRAAAVTGLGAVTAIGNTLDAISSSLQAGRSGIVLDEERLYTMPVLVAERVQAFDPTSGELLWSSPEVSE